MLNSLLAYGLLLTLALGGQTFGLPGLQFLWKERRVSVKDLQIVLAPVPPAVSVPRCHASCISCAALTLGIASYLLRPTATCRMVVKQATAVTADTRCSNRPLSCSGFSLRWCAQ